VVAYAPDSFGVATRIAGLGIVDVVVRFGRSLNSSWNREPGDDSDDQGKGSDYDDRPQRDPDCEWHAPISLHVRSDQTRGGFLYHTENLPSEGASRMSIGSGMSIAIVWGWSAMGGILPDSIPGRAGAI
jgi:hypothetical protein